MGQRVNEHNKLKPLAVVSSTDMAMASSLNI